MNATAGGNRRQRAALVLAGGGLAGVAYETGALHALDCLLRDFSVNDFDIVVGTSAGALVGSLLTNGLTPGALMITIEGTHPETRPAARADLWRLNTGRILRHSASIPGRLLGGLRDYVGDFKDASLFNLLWTMMDLLPSAMYQSENLEAYLREVLEDLGLGNRFDELPKDLYVVTTRLDNGQRAVFDRRTPEVPVSLAVAASAAVPVIYEPVIINGVEYVDGGIRGNASIDVAIEQGAGVVFCINPMVPYDNSNRPGLDDTPGDPHAAADAEDDAGPDGRLGDESMQAIVNQVLRTMMHAGLHYHIKQLRRAHPDVDIVLIEPKSRDYEMSFDNIMQRSSLMTTAEYAFASVVQDIMEHYAEMEGALKRHGMRLQPRLSDAQLEQARAAESSPRVLSELLGTTWPPEVGQRVPEGVRRLNGVLANLEDALALLPAVGDKKA